MSDRRRLLREIALLLFILLPCFLLMLGARPLNVPDEGRYPEVAREMLISGDFITPRVNGAVFLDKPALYYWLEAGSMKAFGVNPTAIRLAPALFGVFGCLLVFLTAYRFFSRRAAWFAAFALASSPLYFLASQYANLDLEVAVWITAALVGFLFGQAEPLDSPWRRWFFILAYLAGGFGVLTKGLIGIVLPSIVIFGWMLWQMRWRYLPRWGLHWLPICVLLVCVPWYSAVQVRNPQFLHFFFVYQQFERYTGGGFNNVFPWWFYPAVLALGLLPWSIWLPSSLWNAWQQRHRDRGIRAFLLTWPLIILLFFSLPASKIVSYILPTVPPLALLTGAAFDRWLAQGESSKWRGLLVGLLLLAGTAGLFVFSGKVVNLPKYALHPELTWLLRGLAVSLAIAACVVLFSLRRSLALTVFGLVLAGGSCALWLGPIVPSFDKESVRATAEFLAPRLGADAVVVTYHNYYQDLPIYLNRVEPIRVVDDWTDPNIVKIDNWRREFFFALKDQAEARKLLLDEAGFQRLLAEPKPVYVVIDSGLASKVAQAYGLSEIWRTPRFVVLTKSAAKTPSGG